ncbi:MAG: ATPase [Clostridium sp.]|nr:ATPase [Clostridium sp.]MCM1547636.1 ATPase [Ruminococcus sp.]
MSIEKMKLVTIVGLMKNLDRALGKCADSGCFHITDAVKESASDGTFKRLDGENPYKLLLKRLVSVKTGSGFTFERSEFSHLTPEEMEETVSKLEDEFNCIDDSIVEHTEKIQQRKQVLTQITHLKGMKIDFRKLFECSHISIRFGRLPCESTVKLSHYSDRTFIFIPYDDDGSYQWGFYFAPTDIVSEADSIFRTLYFERIKIPEYVRETPEKEEEILTRELSELESELEKLERNRNDLIEKHTDTLNGIFSYLKYSYDVFELRSNVAAYKDKFYIAGFVPKSSIDEFKKMFESLPDVSVVIKNAEENNLVQTPVKLKSNRFSKPFSMFVEMYGLPSYNGFNPTTLVALTYTVLFGIMFGDLGQGLAISLIGWLVYKKSGNKLGAIMQRIGISSAFFGLIYGSVFGFEEALTPLYKRLGFEHKPFDVMENTMNVLLGAILIGVVIIFIAITVNIIISFKHKDYENAIFGNNGLAGFVLFGSLLAGIACAMTGIANLFTAPYIICLIVLPVILMFFREPLGCLVKGEKFHLESGIGDFIASNFFEVFEFMLGYATNTLSFVRIGGFVFSHAGMMSVVMLLSETAAKGVSPIIIIIGNIFVMGVEGLIVGIQVLRLEFYEVFSRFYDGNGQPFEPVTIKYDANIE